MRQTAMLRFLDLVRKEFSARDTRAELGGLNPDDPCLLWTRVAGGFRIVVVMDAPPVDRAERQARLEALAAGFAQTLNQTQVPAAPVTVESPYGKLDVALEALRARTGAVGVVIVDGHSPVLWGASEPERHEDDADDLVDIGEALSGLMTRGLDLDTICGLQPDNAATWLSDHGVTGGSATVLMRALIGRDDTALRHYLLTCLAVARTRGHALPPGLHATARFVHHDVQFGYFVRGFANIYLLVLVFEGAFSELYVESGVVHSLPAIEQLLLSLPPLDPQPGAKRGRVIPLRGR